MIVKELIRDKDYPLIQFRYTHPDIPEGVFFGQCKSENGELISLDGDIYDEFEEVISSEEFEHDGNICLDVTVKGEWLAIKDGKFVW